MTNNIAKICPAKINTNDIVKITTNQKWCKLCYKHNNNTYHPWWIIEVEICKNCGNFACGTHINRNKMICGSCTKQKYKYRYDYCGCRFHGMRSIRLGLLCKECGQFICPNFHGGHILHPFDKNDIAIRQYCKKCCVKLIEPEKGIMKIGHENIEISERTIEIYKQLQKN